MLTKNTQINIQNKRTSFHLFRLPAVAFHLVHQYSCSSCYPAICTGRPFWCPTFGAVSHPSAWSASPIAHRFRRSDALTGCHSQRLALTRSQWTWDYLKIQFKKQNVILVYGVFGFGFISLTIRSTLVQKVLGKNYTFERFAQQIEFYVKYVARAIRLDGKEFAARRQRRRPTCPAAMKHEVE